MEFSIFRFIEKGVKIISFFTSFNIDSSSHGSMSKVDSNWIELKDIIMS